MDSNVALLTYCTAPLPGSDKSPVKLLLNRQLRIKLPAVINKLVSEHAETIRSQLADRQQQRMACHDRRPHDLPSLKSGDVVQVHMYI